VRRGGGHARGEECLHRGLSSRTEVDDEIVAVFVVLAQRLKPIQRLDTPADGFARGTLALMHLTGVLAAGNHKLDVTCDGVDDYIDWANVRLVAARVG
jgi:hypothetical protein